MLRTFNLLRQAWKPLASSVRFYYPKHFYDMLKLLPEPQYSVLDNGLTVVSEERINTNHVCVGLFIDGGSRYESKYENGIAHFFEHMAFTGTFNRTLPVLQQQMADTGARFKCFTTRELVGYYTECLAQDLCAVVDILADCLYCNELNEKQIEIQKKVVLQEMIEKDADTNDVLWDYLHGAAFMGTPFAQSVMGPSSNLSLFNERNVRTYITQFFDPTRTVLAAVGAVNHERLVEFANCYLLKLEPCKCTDEFYRFTSGDIRFRDDAYPYCHTAIAFEAPCLCDSNSWTMEVAAEYIGGYDRTQAGKHSPHLVARASALDDQAYAYKSFYIKYKDTGLWGVQMLANHLEQDSLFYNVQTDLMNLCSMVTDNEVTRAKRAAQTRLLTKLEGVTPACIDLGRWTLYNGRQPSLVEKLCEIEKVTAEDVRRMCDTFLWDRCPAVAAVGRVESVPVPTRIRPGQYWLRL
ncbi:insulinase (Peptidase family m16) domain-containing protein [Phthorimaea operculella]|nr:insulinase (Peptidase family m16) domain-containing protein [Phthorimaea operculella]